MSDEFSDWFWWLERVDHLIDQQFTARRDYAWEITGASKRQERLQMQQNVLRDMGSDHQYGGEPGTYEGGDANVPHKDDEPYQEQSKTVHKLQDGWSIKRLHTFGDMRYEGDMMNHCIGQDADGGECEDCGGGGDHGACDGSGKDECSECEGEGNTTCEDCAGTGAERCDNCSEAVNTAVPCHNCRSTGKLPNDGTGERDCSHCGGSGHRISTHYTSTGKVDCDECDGQGTDSDGDDCGHCDGEGKVNCETCDGEGEHHCSSCEGEGIHTCSNCEGDGRTDCYGCDGSGSCPTCGGEGRAEGSGNAGPKHYYRHFDEDEADNFGNSPGGGLSLRDSDNIPSVTFLEDDHQHGEINNVFGRGDKMPSAEHQHRILKYLKTTMPGEGVDQAELPGMEKKCQNCSGKGFQPYACDTCRGRGHYPVTSDTEGITQKDCEDCGATGKKNEGVTCDICKGTGDPTVGVGWATSYARNRYTKNDIDSILGGTYQRPDTFLLAQHKDNKNEIHTFKDINEAKNFGNDYSPVQTKEPCSDCNPRGNGGFNPHCDRCGGGSEGGGQGWVKGIRAGKMKEVFNLHALPSSFLGVDQTIYNPALNNYEVKSGRGSKLPIEESGAHIPWGATFAERKECPSCKGDGYERDEGGERILDSTPPYGVKRCTQCGSKGIIQDHTQMHALQTGLPEFARNLLPRVAMVTGWRQAPQFACPRCQASVNKPGETCASCNSLVGRFEDTDSTTNYQTFNTENAVGDPGYRWERDSHAIAEEVSGWKSSSMTSLPPSCEGCGTNRLCNIDGTCSVCGQMRFPAEEPLPPDPVGDQMKKEHDEWKKKLYQQPPAPWVNRNGEEHTAENLNMSKHGDLIPFPPGKDGDVDQDTWLPPYNEGYLHEQFVESPRNRRGDS